MKEILIKLLSINSSANESVIEDNEWGNKILERYE